MTGPGSSASGPREWAAEIELDEPAVRALVGDQFPDVSLDGLRPFAAGWDNALWVTGEGTAFRFPRRSVAVAGVMREMAVLPGLAARLPLAIPTPVHFGAAVPSYPWPFFGAPLLEGREIATVALDGRREQFGEGLATFLRALHDPANSDLGRDLPHDPMGRADMPARVARTRARFAEIEALGLWTAPARAHAILDDAARLPASEERSLVHGDLHVRHVLVNEQGVPAAVIDWGDVCVGDPAIDLALYWSQLDGGGREAFREAYAPDALPPARLLRARVLALFLDSALAAYAHDTHDDALLRTTLDGLARALED